MCQREPERGFVCELLKEGEREGVWEGGKRDSQLGITRIAVHREDKQRDVFFTAA